MGSTIHSTRERPIPTRTARIGSNCRKTLPLALDSLEHSPLFRREMGDLFVNYYLALKRKETDRFAEFVKAKSLEPSSEEVTDWEQNEYFLFSSSANQNLARRFDP